MSERETDAAGAAEGRDPEAAESAPGVISGKKAGTEPAGNAGLEIPDLGPLITPDAAEQLEQEDRKKPIPGGEPSCPTCGAPMVRHVEAHPAPRGGDSPFRVRLVCSSNDCRAWTVYDW
jgi:hypothetical protein